MDNSVLNQVQLKLPGSRMIVYSLIHSFVSSEYLDRDINRGH